MSTVLLEKDIQKQILEYLAIKGVMHWRNNSGAMKTLRGFVRFGTPGSPDIFAVKAGVLWGIEVKREKKGRLSPLQKEFGEKLVKAGAQYIVVTSLDEVMAIL